MKKKNSDPFIGAKEDAELYMTRGSDIETGYRVNFRSYRQALSSLFMLHNETVNIWTHFIGSLCFIYLIYYVVVWLAPATFDSDRSLVQRWTGNLDA
jgi:adiponectin receptor